jgi:hypothetical protein
MILQKRRTKDTRIPNIQLITPTIQPYISPEQNFSLSQPSSARNIAVNFTKFDLNNNDVRIHAPQTQLFYQQNTNLQFTKIKKPVFKREDTEQNETILEVYGTIPIDWMYYLNTYPDLRENGILSKTDAYNHWKEHGEKEGRIPMEHYSLFKTYPNLFHKYLLGLANSESLMKYTVIKRIDIKKPYICSIHCYDLRKFIECFGANLKKIQPMFDIIVTYVYEHDSIVSEYDFTFIQIINKGMDIGTKFVITDYLKANNIDYDYVFFIHSKSNALYRNKYIQSFVENMDEIKNILYCKSYDAIFNGQVHIGTNWVRNEIYMNEIISYLNLDKTYFNFPAGNFYIISKEVCESIFLDLKLYNILNTNSSFDYAWVKKYYNLNGDYESVFEQYKKAIFYGNNVETLLGHKGLADCMIEHVFERIMFLILKREKKEFFICDQHGDKIVKSIDHFNLNVAVIACHTNNEMKINTIVNNISYLTTISDVIYIIDSDCFMNNGLIEAINETYKDICINYELTDYQATVYISENPDLANMTIEQAKSHFKTYGYKEPNRLHIFSSFIFVDYCVNYGYCYGKWLYFLDKTAGIENYSNYILTNDSFLITRPLDKFDALIQEDKYDIISISASNQVKYHYTDFLRCYNKRSIHIYKEFVKKQLSISTKFSDVIMNIELPSVHLFSTRGCAYDSEEGYDKNIHFDDEKLMYYLNVLNYPIVKLKKINNNFYNELGLPSDFNGETYKSLHPDLTNHPNPVEHFLVYGLQEGRIYKPNQRITIQNQLKEYLNNYASQNRDICKIDFENYSN